MASALRAGFLDDRAPPLAAWAGLLHGENTLADADLAGTSAGVAGDRRVTARGAGAAAFGAFLYGLEVDLGCRPEDCLLEVEREFIAQVRPAIDGAAAAAATAAEDVAEHVAEDVAKGVGRAESLASAARSVEAGAAVLIVCRALLCIGQDLVRLLRFLEMLFGFLVVGIPVRVVFHGQAPVRLGDGVFGGVSWHAKHLVEITLRHGCSACAAAG